MDGQLNLLINNILAPRTTKTYRKVWFQFQDFVIDILKTPFVMPVNTSIVVKYIASLVLKDYTHGTIASNLSVLTYAHGMRQMPDPTTNFVVKKLMLAVKKLQVTWDKRQPITITVLTLMMNVIESLNLLPYEHALARADLCVMYHAGLRISEVAAASGSTQHAVLITDLFTIKHLLVHVAF